MVGSEELDVFGSSRYHARARALAVVWLELRASSRSSDLVDSCRRMKDVWSEEKGVRRGRRSDSMHRLRCDPAQRVQRRSDML